MVEKEIKLKVGELTGREDFGRGIARLDTKLMSRLDVKEGDIMEIEGKNKTGAVAIRSYPSDVGLNLLRVDGLVRKNCDASIGENVTIRKADAKEAKRLVLAPAQKGFMLHISPNLIRQNLYMRPMKKGDIIITNPVFKTRNHDHDDIFSIFGIDIEEVFMPMGAEMRLVVVDAKPDGVTKVTDMTEIEILPEAAEVSETKLPTVTYEDIGGLSQIVPKIREMIEIPLRHPEIFERLGVEPPKGVLLYGPPGCLTGEALIAIEDGRLARIGEIGKNLIPGIYVADLPVYPPAHAKAIHVYDVPETVEIMTKSGRRLRMTPNHPLMTDNGWVEAEKLKIGDNVKIFNWIPNPQNYVPTNFNLNKKGLVNEIKVPKIWDEKLAEIVGIFVAEGSVETGRIKFSIHRDENDLRERIICLMTELFDANITEKVEMVKAIRRIKIANRGISDFFKSLWTREKIIPQEILLSPNSVAAGFLRGVFEGDGSVVKKNRHFDRAVTLKSKSRKLLEEVQILLLRWSIRSSIYEDKGKLGIRHVLKIRGKGNLRKFKENIGLISKIKNEKLNAQLSSYKRKTPNEEKEFEPVKKVERIKGWERVYDFEVPTTHSFFSNGILSHNTGKTLIAKAVANEAGAHFISVAGPEFMSKFYGESEENLRKIFDEAEKNAPAIVFIDEIDAIAPKREQVTGEVERRIVSTLLTQMDGLKSRGKVVVIAATNRVNALDPALRRSGRFDREIEIPVPDKKGRKEILQIHTRQMPLDKDVDLDYLAEITYGYVGADISGLAKEAAMHALRRVIPEVSALKEDEQIPKEILEKLKVTKEDFDYALRMVQPSGMREVLIEIPKTKWEDVGGLEEVKLALKEAVEMPLKNPDCFKRIGIKPPRGVLLYGPPGCGKTYIVQALANETGVNFIAIKGPELLSKWVGESEEHVREVFKRAKQVAPSIILFDEIDALAPRRGMEVGSRVTEQVVSQLLTEMSGISELEGVAVVATTNRPDIIDPALLRPGRFDRLIYVPAPDEKTRMEILKVHTKNMPLKGVDTKKLVKETEGYSGADIESLCREAAMFALREDVKAKFVESKHFEKALKKVKPSIAEDVFKRYQKAVEDLRKTKIEEEEKANRYIG
ncbi:hypothetical protein A3K64_01625 [Candidatus Micrarchaeota archaeon RBG_16_36_9]|nr:MAG: hypothetical protein A3K64_01625 [Candidatus Micrarchaeota archaeon RBG_16_36_9]